MPDRFPNNLRRAWAIGLIFVLAFGFRFARIHGLSAAEGDQAMHGASAMNYGQRGYFGPDNWYHPPLKHLLLYGSMRLFGNNDYGLKLRNILFGAGTVALLFVFAGSLGGGLSAFLSAILLLVDPLHIQFSRTTFEDVPAAFFLLAGVLFALKAYRARRRRDFVLSGIAFGLAVALKWYCLPVLFAFFAVLLFKGVREAGWRGSIPPVVYMALLPATAYVLVFLPWLARGYSLGGWWEMQIDALRELRSATSDNFIQTAVLQQLGTPLEWFVKPIAVAFKLDESGPTAVFVTIMNDMPIWMFIPPAAAFMAYRGVRQKDLVLMLPSLVFGLLYLSFLLISRPIFLYSSIALLPFGFAALGYGAEQILKKRALVFAALTAAWSLYLYPLVIGVPVLSALYQPLLSRMAIFASR